MAVAASTLPGAAAFGLTQAEEVLAQLEQQGARFRTRRGWIPFFKVYKSLDAHQVAENLPHRSVEICRDTTWNSLNSYQQVQDLGYLSGVTPPSSEPELQAVLALERRGARFESDFQALETLRRGGNVDFRAQGRGWRVEGLEEAHLAAYLLGEESYLEKLERPDSASWARHLFDQKLEIVGARHPLEYPDALKDGSVIALDGHPLLKLKGNLDRRELQNRRKALEALLKEAPRSSRSIANWALRQPDYPTAVDRARSLVARGLEEPQEFLDRFPTQELSRLPATLESSKTMLALELGATESVEGFSLTYGRLPSGSAGIDALRHWAAQLPKEQRSATSVVRAALDSPGLSANQRECLPEVVHHLDFAAILGAPDPQAAFSEALELTTAIHRGIEELRDALRNLTGKEPSWNLDLGCWLNGRTTSTQELKKLATELRADPSIPFDYIYDGCYARAHLMCRELGQMGVARMKLFVHGDLAAKNQYQDVTWGWHVAPMVVVEGKDGPELRILDPSFTEEPMTPTEWIRRFYRSGALTLHITDEKQYMERPHNGLSPDMDHDMSECNRVMAEYAQILEGMKAQA